MAIKNKPTNTFWSIQSSPTDHGNHYRVRKPQTSAVNVTLSTRDSGNRYKRNILSDQGHFKFGGSSYRRRKSRKKVANKRYYSVLKKIPNSSFSKSTASHFIAANMLSGFSSVKLWTAMPRPKDVPADSTKSEVILGSMEGSDRFLREHSLTNMRPELIASFDWIPVQKTWRGGLSDLDKFLEFRWIMRQLQIENVEETMKKLKEEDVGSIFSDLEQQYEFYIEQEKKWVKWRKLILGVLQSSKLALDIKDADNGYSSYAQGVLVRYSDVRPNGLSIEDASLRSLFVNSLGFSEEGYDKFSNSKVMGQLLNDLNYICYHHSPVFLPVKGSERSKDHHSTRINKKFIPNEKKYRFRAHTIGNRSVESRGEVKESKFDATDFKDYSKFLSTLPSSDADKIKVLINTLSKEFRVSAGMGYLQGSSLGKRFNVSSRRGPFRGAFGYPRSNIMEENVLEGSLASFILMNDTTGKLILPFETRTFSDRRGRTAIPGNVALVDNIMRFGNLSNGLDVGPYSKFANGFNDTSNDVVEYIESILNLDDPKLRLHARTIYTMILSKFRYAISGLINNNRKNDNQIIFAALMNLAKEDASLRHMMLRFILEVRDSNDAIETETSLRDVLEADADNPKPKRKTPSFRLSSIGTFSQHPGITPAYIQTNFGVSSGQASTLLSKTRNMSSFNSLMLRANVPKDNRKRLFSLASRWQDTAVRIAVKARKLMDTQAEIPRAIGDRSILNVRKGGVIAALRHSLSRNAHHLPVAMIIDLAREIQDKADDLADRRSESASFMSSGKLTKYNGWDENTLIAVLFEVFALLYDRYVAADFARKNRDLYVKYSAEKIDKVNEAILDVLRMGHIRSEESRDAQGTKRLAEDTDVRTHAMIKDMAEGNLSTSAALQSVTNDDYDDAVFADIYGFMTAYDKESEIIYHMLSIIDGIGTNLKQQSITINRYFNTSDVDTSAEGMVAFQNNTALSRQHNEQIRRYLAFKAQSKFGRDVLRTLTPHSLALNRVAAEKFGRRENDDTWLPADMIIEIEELRAIKTFLNNPAMKGVRGDNIRVLTVGIPAETLEVLQNPPYIMGSRFNSELPVMKDVFEVHVHKRDLEWEDVVFKPKKFIFDRSMFLLSEAFKNVKATSSFDYLAKKVEFTNATKDELKNMSAMDIYNSSEYSFLSAEQRTQMIQNHVSNRVLHLYYRLLSGLHMDENTFLINDGWGDLFVDRDASTMLQMAQLDDTLYYWLNTGTVPAMNIFIETNVEWDHTTGTRLRVGTYQDSEIFTRPTWHSVASFARDATERIVGPEQPYRKTIETTDTTLHYSRSSVSTQGDGKSGYWSSSKLRKGKKVTKTYVDTWDTVSRSRSLGITNYSYGHGRNQTVVKQTQGFIYDPKSGYGGYYGTTNVYNTGTIYTGGSWSKRGANPQLDWVSPTRVRVLARDMHRRHANYFRPFALGKHRKKGFNGGKVYHSSNSTYKTITRSHSYFNITTTSEREYVDWDDQVNKDRLAHNKAHWRHEWDTMTGFAKRFFKGAPRCTKEQLHHFRCIAAGRIFSPIVMTNQVIAARQFDRVLMLPVDPDDFEIDMDATLSVLEGKSTFEKRDFLKLTYNSRLKDGRIVRKLKPRHRSENYSSFYDFYVTISTITHEEKK